jgi:hypothetical protein
MDSGRTKMGLVIDDDADADDYDDDDDNGDDFLLRFRFLKTHRNSPNSTNRLYFTPNAGFHLFVLCKLAEKENKREHESVLKIDRAGAQTNLSLSLIHH